MTEFWLYLHQPFALHALVAAALVAVCCGLIAPFVIQRSMAFAVHGISELAFTGAALGLLLGISPVLGAIGGGLVVAMVMGWLGVKEHDRDSAIGVILAFGLGLGILFLGWYRGFATQATNILFGNIFGVSSDQLALLGGISLIVVVGLSWIYRPLLFASVDPEVAEAKGIPLRRLGLLFFLLLALTVTEAAQIVGTLLVLSLAITPAASAMRFTHKPMTVAVFSIIFALIASVGGVLLSLALPSIKPSVLVSGVSFALYLCARIYQRLAMA